MIILALILMIISLFVFVINKRSAESIWLSGLFIGFIMSNIGLMFYYAKMGGLIEKEQIFFFLTPRFQHYIQSAIITINDITRLLTWGRNIFLYFVMIFSLFISGQLQKHYKLLFFTALIPLCHSIATDPVILYKLNTEGQDFLMLLGNVYLIAYLSISIIFMLREYFDNNIRWVKKQLRSITIFVGNMILYFIIFCQVNPMNMMYYSKYTVLNIGFKIYRLRFSIFAWYIVLGLFSFFIITGLFALFRYASVSKEEHKENISLERQMNTANLGTQVFIHGIKNQLFSEKIILQKLSQIYDSKLKDTDDSGRYIQELTSINENMTTRIEKLYQMFRNNAMSLIPCHLSEIVDATLKKVENQFDNIQYNILIEKDSLVLADKQYLSEALYNVINNSISAIKSSVRSNNGLINIILKAEHQWCAIRIEDNGIGIEKDKLKKVFEPFYTNKNSNYNWGIGLSYVKQIAKYHFGKVYLESTLGEGTVFIIALPIYKPNKKNQQK